MKLIRRLFIFLLIVFFIIDLISTDNENLNSDGSICQDELDIDKANGNREHQREWLLQSQEQNYCLEYHSNFDTCKVKGTQREVLLKDLKIDQSPWAEVYARLARNSKESLKFLADSLMEKAVKENLDKIETAELLVNFVQDIPYAYVLPFDCASYETKGFPCMGNVPFGIVSPYEFIHFLYGDCDTRAVLLYALLDNLGYKPAIVESDEYAHAMIALNIQSSGDYIMHKGRKYYFWETTAKGWPLGMLPPGVNNVEYWKIALVNEL